MKFFSITHLLSSLSPRTRHPRTCPPWRYPWNEELQPPRSTSPTIQYRMFNLSHLCSWTSGKSRHSRGSNWTLKFRKMWLTIEMVWGTKMRPTATLHHKDFNLYLNWKFLPQDLVSPRVQVHPVFPEAQQQKHLIFWCFCLERTFASRFLTTGPFDPGRPLSPCRPAGPWNRTWSQCELVYRNRSDSVCYSCYLHEGPEHQCLLEYLPHPAKHNEFNNWTHREVKALFNLWVKKAIFKKGKKNLGYKNILALAVNLS